MIQYSHSLANFKTHCIQKVATVMNRSSKTITVIIISAVNNDTFTEGAKILCGETTQEGGEGLRI